jgi:hypothetical protein
MPTLYFSYSLPSGSLDIDEPLNSPYTISYHVGHMLRQKAHERGYDFKFVSLDDTTPQAFGADDITIGHLWDAPNSFMQQALNADVKAKIILQPYSHDMVSTGDIPRYVEMFSRADHLLWVTGEYWSYTMHKTPYAVLKGKSTRIDMALNTSLHPFKKTRWNKKGERSICVIGNDTPTKGYRNVAELARVAGIRLGHFGSAAPNTFDHVPHMTYHGGMLFTPDNIERLCSQYDALVVIAEADANPTVLLEAASWGLRVYCNREAGYLPNAPFEELRKDDMRFNVSQMRAFQEMSEYDLRKDSATLRYVMERDYTWAKFCHAVWEKVSEYL